MSLAPPLLADRRWVTDGGLETDLIFHHGVDLPDFAAYPLLDDEHGRALLRRYFASYAGVARAAGAGLLLETPTWRASPDWGTRLGHDAADLDRLNRAAVDLLDELRSEVARHSDAPPVLVSGTLGPRGDGYTPGERVDPDEAAAYHAPQLAAFRAAGADLAHALTLTGVEEAVGVVTAARAAGLPVAVSFTVETDGRLPDGTLLAAAVEQVDEVAPPDWFGVNCAHPTHVAPALTTDPATGSSWRDRIVTLRPNASTLTHAELDEAEELDEGDLDLLAASVGALLADLPGVRIVGGCCGTDVRHVAALWSVPVPT